MVSKTLSASQQDSEFLALLEESFSVGQPERGDLLTGTILTIDALGMIVDVAMKRDAVVPRSDLDRLDGVQFTVGQDVAVVVIQPEDADGNLIVSVSQARQSEDWVRADDMMNSGEIWEGVVADANRGGLIIPFGNLRGFIPASHVADLPRGLDEENRKDFMLSFVNKKISAKVIEVNRKRRRLVLSQRDAQRERRDTSKESLLEALKEGEVRRGRVSGLRDFGAFVDLGGADGLIHISELAWCRVKHPSELLNVGDEIDVYILRLDQDTKRIGLSLKRLQPNPWTLVDEMYHVGQLVEGTISRVAQFGAFVSLEPGIEALLHANQIADPAPEDPTLHLVDGSRLLMRVISIEPQRQRLGLSLKDVTEEERERWLNGQPIPEPEPSVDAVSQVE
ncbi:MAG: S1 RNA-binding domain-containing protein [Anaerolineae bacterium]|nr:S1 RNA-binding domain-containing protein [Anaerolineae bacterium]CAG1004379.1 30S ribosomal protein S1 [Anaerolineae bacterium]